MCYHCTVSGAEDQGTLFTGDTLFVGGCGRPMECSPEDLHRSLTMLGILPSTTSVYVGHEYTVANLNFAVGVDVDNEQLKQMLGWAKEQVLQRKYTVPSTLQNEWLINPFMRANTDLQSVCPGCTPVQIFTELRRQKNAGKGDRALLEKLVA